MAHDVFISYSSKDKLTADAACAKLEAECIRCWIAPRDVAHGKDWGESIIEAINGSRVMVLIFSSSANTSPQIVREVERAVSKGITIIPLRIEDIKPTAAMEYFLSSPHWLDAYHPPMDRHFRYLAQVIQRVLTGPTQKTAAAAPTKPPPSSDAVKEVLSELPPPPAVAVHAAPPESGKDSKAVWWLALLAVAGVLAGGVWWLKNNSHLLKPEAGAVNVAAAISNSPPVPAIDELSRGVSSPGVAPVFHADERFVELDDANGFYASHAVPAAAVTALKEAQTGAATLLCFTFNAKGEWVLLTDQGHATSDETLSPCKKMTEWHSTDVKCLTFSPKGAWVTLSSYNGFYGPGSHLWSKVAELSRGGHGIRSAVFGPNDSWVVLYDKTAISYAGIPESLAKVLDDAVTNDIAIRCVAFTGKDWICFSRDALWTSDPNLPAARLIDQQLKAGQHPKWVAFVPNFGSVPTSGTVSTPVPVAAKPDLKSGLVLYYSFDRAASDGKVTDQSGHGNDGLPVNVQWSPQGHHGSSAKFSLTNSYITVPNKDELNPAQVTLAAWVRTAYTDWVWRRIFDKGTGKGYDLTMAGDNKGKSFRGQVCMEPGKTFALSGVEIADGRWHHVVGTFNGMEARVYVDGQPAGTPNHWTGDLPHTAYDLTIGANRSNPDRALGEVGASFNGEMDDLMLFNRALSAAEIKALFESQK